MVREGVLNFPWWTLAALLTAWSIGIMAATLLSPLAPWLALVFFAAAGISIASRRFALLAGVAFVALLLGAGRAALATTPELPPGLAGQVVTVSGAVDDDPVERKSNRRITVRVDWISSEGAHQPRGLRIEATIYGATPVHYGDLVLLAGEIQPPPRLEQFDYRAYLAEQGIAGVMPSARLVRAATHPSEPLHTLLFALRRALIDAIDRALPEPQAALVLGVVFGYRAALPVGLQQHMIASGLIHIVVISGLKVSLLARIIHDALGRWLPRTSPVIAVGAMAGYALLAGASAAALRAAAMGALVVIAGRLRRDSHIVVSLALTGALMLGLKPALARDVSFQLSFAGTIGIATLTDSIASHLRWMPTVLRDPFAATLAAEAATWPLMLANFHQISLVAPAANALVLPLLPAVMIAGGGGALLGIPVAWLGWPAMQVAGLIAAWFRLVTDGLGSTPMAAIVMPYFPSQWLAAAAIANGGALAGIKLRQFFWQRKVWALLGAAGLIAIALLVVRPDGRVHVYALDVGTGSAVLIRTPNGHQILIDAGPDADRFAQAIGRALPPTARTIDVWLVTGGRRENIGAAATVLNRFAIGAMVVADPDPWSVTLRLLVQQAQTAGVVVESSNGRIDLDGVSLHVGADGRTWVIQAGLAGVAIIPPETSWSSTPAGIDAAIFTNGGPLEWFGPGKGVSVVQVAANSRAGLPVRAVLQAMGGAPIARTDLLGTVELVALDGRFQPVSQ
jgi:competence protein ComEC